MTRPVTPTAVASATAMPAIAVGTPAPLTLPSDGSNG